MRGTFADLLRIPVDAARVIVGLPSLSRLECQAECDEYNRKCDEAVAMQIAAGVPADRLSIPVKMEPSWWTP